MAGAEKWAPGHGKHIKKRVVCRAYKNFYKDNPSIPTYYLRGMLRLILSSKKICSTSMDSATEPRWAKRQQIPLPIFSPHILKHKFSVSKTFQGRSQGGTWGARDPPLVGLLLSKQPTIFRWRKRHDNILAVKAIVEKPTFLKFVFL